MSRDIESMLRTLENVFQNSRDVLRDLKSALRVIVRFAPETQLFQCCLRENWLQKGLQLSGNERAYLQTGIQGAKSKRLSRFLMDGNPQRNSL